RNGAPASSSSAKRSWGSNLPRFAKRSRRLSALSITFCSIARNSSIFSSIAWRLVLNSSLLGLSADDRGCMLFILREHSWRFCAVETLVGLAIVVVGQWVHGGVALACCAVHADGGATNKSRTFGK